MNKYTYFDRTNDLYDIKKPALAKFLISQGFDRTIIKQWMNDEEYFDESINNSFMGDLEDSTDGEIEDWAKTEMEFYSEGNDWIDESQLTTESLRMQMLAGIITESQYKTKLKKFTILENKFNSAVSRLMLNESESFTPEDNIDFKWNIKPLNPQGELTSEDGETFTKKDFWESDIIGTDPSMVFPNYGNKNEDGTWTLTFDEGEISGFIKGEDFTL
jgi:hypothetical protein